MASNKRTREVLEEFISIYQKSPCLWQIKSKDYHNKNKREAAYKSLINKLMEIDEEANRDSVVKKINGLRTNIRKEKKKIEHSQRSGSGTDELYTPTLWYFSLFDFLDDQVTPRKSSSNLNNDTDEITENPPNVDSQDYIENVDNNQSQLDQPIIPSTNFEKSVTPKRNPPARPLKRATPDINSVCQTIEEHFKKPKIKEDRYDVFGKNISLKLRDIPDNNQRLLAEKLINGAVFLAETSQLTFGHAVTAVSQTVPILQQQKSSYFLPQKRYESTIVSTPFPSPTETVCDNEYRNDDSNLSLASYLTNYSA